jgi:AcrR family transcriptional regulator
MSASAAQPADAQRTDARRGRGVQRENTRARLIAATVELLGARSLDALSATDIAATAGLSNAAFYVYFRDVHAAVLAAVESVAQLPAGIIELAAQPWIAQDADSSVDAFLAGYFAHWDAWRPVLRARNLAAEEGRPEFVIARQLGSQVIADAWQRQIAAGQAAGRIPARYEPRPLAHVILALLERTGAVQRDYDDLGPAWHAEYTGAVKHTLLAVLGFRRSRRGV